MIEMRSRRTYVDDEENDGVFSGNDSLSNVGGDRTNTTFYASLGCLFLVVIVLYLSGGSRGGDGVDGGGVIPSDIPNVNLHEGATGSEITSAGTKTSSTRQHRFPPKLPEKHRQIQPRPMNLNVIFIGDTITRYQYLSLVYFLRWGRWFDLNLERSNLVNEWSFDNPFHSQVYNEFFFQTNIMLQPYELCDCRKIKDKTSMRDTVIENRYYHDPILNNTVTFLHAFGDELAMHGRIKATEVYTEAWKWSTKEKGLVSHDDTVIKWQHETWDETVKEYVANIRPRPEFAILNAGRWSNSFGPSGSRKSGTVAGALVSAKIYRKYWRTTTYTRAGDLLNQEECNNKETDAYMCDKLFTCLNVSWTKDVPESLYWDESNFHEPVYRVINEEMMHDWRVLPEGYLKYDKSLLTTGKIGPTDAPTATPTRKPKEEVKKDPVHASHNSTKNVTNGDATP